MDSPHIVFPAACPHCASPSAIALPLRGLVESLLRGGKVWLQGECHHGWWATDEEADQLRRQLAELGIESRGP